jgi:hypothetical protein
MRSVLLTVDWVGQVGMSNSFSRIGWKPQNYEARTASARIRCLNTIRELRAQKFPVELYKERHESGYKAVVFSKAYTHKDITIAQRLKHRGTIVVFDLCDNHFLLGSERVARLRKMFDLADHWVVSSEALVDVVRGNVDTVKPLWVIEDAVEEGLRGPLLDVVGWIKARYQLLQLRRFLDSSANRGAAHLVWFGNHKASYGDSGLSHMQKLRPLLERICQARPVTLTVISDSRDAFTQMFAGWKIPMFYIDWSAHTFFAALELQGIALIPIDVNAFTEVKTNNRIAQSLNLGLGVVADSIPSYRVFERCAFLDNWEEGLEVYLEGPEMVAEHVRRGRRLIQENFSTPVITQRWRTLFESL